VRYTNAQYTLLLLKQCNLSCPYCFAKAVLRDVDKGCLCLKDIRKLVDFVFTNDTNHEKVFTLAGGEPALHPEFTDIVEYLLSEQFRLRIFTNGIWPEEHIEYVLNLDDAAKSHIGFLVNYNHDIDKTQKKRLNLFCANVLPFFASTLGMNIYCVDTKHLRTVDLSVIFQVNSVRIGISQPIGGQQVYVRFQDYPELGDWILEVMHYAVNKQVKLFMDCSHPYCMFSDEQHQFISQLLSEGKLGRFNADCAPPLVIGPGLQSWRCFNRHDIAEGKTISDFHDATDLEQYYSRKLNHWNIGLFPDAKCKKCRYRFDASCHAGCAGFHLGDAASMLSHLHEEIAPNIMSCVLGFNEVLLDECHKENPYFSLKCFGKQYQFPLEPYWEILTTLDGKRSLGEIVRAAKIDLSPEELPVLVEMIEAKILTVVSPQPI